MPCHEHAAQPALKRELPMYTQPAFRVDKAEALLLLRERAFGLFVVPAGEAPFAVHVPFVVDETEGGALRVELHVARANPIHTFIGGGCKALLVCQGPDAYISPDWYGVANQVPTWTYTAVHLKGTARVQPEAYNLRHVDRLSAFFEQRLLPKKPWTSGKMDEAKRSAMLKAIVSIAIDVETVDAQKKLIQHKGETEHRGAIDGLNARGGYGDAKIASLIEQTLLNKFGPKQ
jgi:transcriptional regulator